MQIREKPGSGDGITVKRGGRMSAEDGARAEFLEWGDVSFHDGKTFLVRWKGFVQITGVIWRKRQLKE